VKLLAGYRTAEELAAELGVHERTVKRWALDGGLAYVNLGKLFLIDMAASRAKLAARARKALKSGRSAPAK
jgi:excisionase family DNA binding protein